jgi:hypothetical protein
MYPNLGGRVRLNLSVLCYMDEIFSVSENSFVLTKTAFVTSMLMHSMPTIAHQFDAVRTLRNGKKHHCYLLLVTIK